jgi:uncharacterized repeat protein (TIGR01451 family)
VSQNLRSSLNRNACTLPPKALCHPVRPPHISPPAIVESLHPLYRVAFLVMGLILVSILIAFFGIDAQAQQPTDANLSLLKVDLRDPVVAGQDSQRYVLQVSNAGPDTATNVVLTDVLPPDVGFLLVLTTQGSCSESGGVVTCMLGSVLVDAPAFVEIEVTIPASVVGTIANSAIVSADQVDPDPADNTDAEETTVLSEADLSLVKDGTPGQVVPGELLTYTLTISNAGPSDAHNLVLTDSLPAEVAFVSATPPPSPGSDPPTWNLGTLPVGESRVLTLTVQVQSWVTRTFTNTAVVTTTSTDPDPADNEDSHQTTPLEPQASLSVLKVGDPAAVAPGELVTYTLVVSNAGPSDAQDVVVTDDLPAEVSLVDANPAPDASPDPLTWNLGTVAAGESKSITVVVRVYQQCDGHGDHLRSRSPGQPGRRDDGGAGAQGRPGGEQE